MEVIGYLTFDELKAAADKLNIKLKETATSHSFRIFDENGKTKELHIKRKPDRIVNKKIT